MSNWSSMWTILNQTFELVTYFIKIQKMLLIIKKTFLITLAGGLCQDRLVSIFCLNCIKSVFKNNFFSS